MTLLQLFRDGGIFMYPLLACSILGLAVILVKFVTLRMAKVRTERLLERVTALVRSGRVDQAIDLCANTRGPVASILLTGLHMYEEGSTARAEQAITHAGRIEMAFLEKGLVVLATVANVAPLIGFLGTVAGMIIAFGAIEAAGEVEAPLVAGGIKVALITTAAGLIIAIPVNMAHNWFVSQIDGLIVDMRRGVQAINDVLWQSTSRPAAGLRSTPAGGFPADPMKSAPKDENPPRGNP
ncbi:MAG: MotA/TolQ/ExbB proton channel family protein [Gemmatimonadota bacterium]